MPVAVIRFGDVLFEDSDVWSTVQAFLCEFLRVVGHWLGIVGPVRTPGMWRCSVVVGGPARGKRRGIVRQHRDLKLAVRGTPRARRAEGTRQRIEIRGRHLVGRGIVRGGSALVAN